MAGPGSVSVPGVTRAWTMLLERFGSRSLQSLLEPAVHYARDGFPISDIVCQAIRERAAAIDDAEWHRVFVPGGAFPRAGECFRQPDLARTLAALGQDADLFYRGRVARAIADRLAARGLPHRRRSRRATRASGASRSRPRTGATPSTRRRRRPRAWPRSSA